MIVISKITTLTGSEPVALGEVLPKTQDTVQK